MSLAPGIHAAAITSNTRAKELADGVEVPQGVLIILSVSSSVPAIIKLTLEAFLAIQIGRTIFQ